MFLHYWSVFFLSIISIHESAHCIAFTRGTSNSLFIFFALECFSRTEQLPFPPKLNFCWFINLDLVKKKTHTKKHAVFICHFVLCFLSRGFLNKTIFVVLTSVFAYDKQHIACKIALPRQLSRRPEGICGFRFLGLTRFTYFKHSIVM